MTFRPVGHSAACRDFLAGFPNEYGFFEDKPTTHTYSETDSKTISYADTDICARSGNN